MRNVQTKEEAKAYLTAAVICAVVFVIVVLGWGLVYRIGG